MSLFLSMTVSAAVVSIDDAVNMPVHKWLIVTERSLLIRLSKKEWNADIFIFLFFLFLRRLNARTDLIVLGYWQYFRK